MSVCSIQTKKGGVKGGCLFGSFPQLISENERGDFVLL